MIFTVALSSLLAAIAMVAPNPRARPRPVHNTKPDPIFHVNPAYIEAETGLIRSWRAADDEDTRQLKQLVESGMVDGYSSKQVKDEYVRFRKFTNKCISDKLSNLRRSHRENHERQGEMECSNGGGQGLRAQNSHYAQAQATGGSPGMDSFQQRFGADIYDERNDEDYDEQGDDMSESMSRLMMEEDDLTFASRSFAGVRSVHATGSNRSVGGRSTVFFGRTSVARDSHRPGILRNATLQSPPKPQSGIATPPRSQVIARTSDVQKLFGGTFAIWVVELWFDNVPRKRCSIHLHILSCACATMIAQRVATDQRHYVCTMPMSLALTTELGLEYLYGRIKRAHKFINNDVDALMWLKQSSRYVARMKTAQRIKAQNPTADVHSNELRIPTGMKVDFELVTMAEDPVFYGRHVVEDAAHKEVHIHIELKAVPKDGFATAIHNNQTYSNTGMESIPEEISCASSKASSKRRGSSSKRSKFRDSDSVRTMEVETVYSEEDEDDHDKGHHGRHGATFVLIAHQGDCNAARPGYADAL